MENWASNIEESIANDSKWRASILFKSSKAFELNSAIYLSTINDNNAVDVDILSVSSEGSKVCNSVTSINDNFNRIHNDNNKLDDDVCSLSLQGSKIIKLVSSINDNPINQSTITENQLKSTEQLTNIDTSNNVYFDLNQWNNLSPSISD